MPNERDPYVFVRRFLEEGPPASRNLAFDAYKDPGFSEGVRIFKFLESLREDLLRLHRRGQPFSLALSREDGLLKLRIEYDREEFKRTAFLKEIEWELFSLDPQIRQILDERDIKA